MKRKITILLLFALVTIQSFAQEDIQSQLDELEKTTQELKKDFSRLKNLKISGYIQTQYQWGQEGASLSVGSKNENTEKSFNRIGIRRGRIKFTYEEKIVSAVFQLDMTEKDVSIKDAYLNIKDPWYNSMAIRAGVFDRPFGNEISYSSSRRESPERSTVFRVLFPNERDLGAMLILQAPKTSPLNILKLKAGLFAGNGIKQETDSKKDFIGHLSLSKTFNNIDLGIGTSYYNGKVYQATENVYKMQNGSFILDNNASNKGKFAKREYFGVDAQFSIQSVIGTSQLRGEYLFGQQPGTSGSSKSPNYSSLPSDDTSNDTYIRKFSGWYMIFAQGIGILPLSAVLKYDYYDPNTKVSKNEIGENGTGKTDLSQHTFGFGGLWEVAKNIRLQAFYEINTNEKTTNIDGYNKDIKDNVFTLRLQYKF